MAGLADAAFARLMAIVKSEGSTSVPVGRTRDALIDADDLDLVSQYRWCFNGRYAYAKVDGGTILMHRLVCPAPAGLFVDHADGNGLNNQRYNLRACTHQENMRNRCRTNGASRFKGVSLCRGAWRAQIGINGVNRKLGTFTSEVQAAKAYDRAVLEEFGQFAKTNKELGLY